VHSEVRVVAKFLVLFCFVLFCFALLCFALLFFCALFFRFIVSLFHCFIVLFYFFHFLLLCFVLVISPLNLNHLHLPLLLLHSTYFFFSILRLFPSPHFVVSRVWARMRLYRGTEVRDPIPLGCYSCYCTGAFGNV
jgi:hypothetical protein